MKKQRIITTIIPVYNVRDYIADTIDSVISQSIGFIPYIDLVLVDDGSTDGSDRVCLEYVKKFPNNIKYIRQINSGTAGSPRNEGLKHAKNKYVHFLDGDDIIGRNFYKIAVNFFENNYSRVDFVATKIKFFDGNIDEHPNNYKFAKTRIIDIDVEPDNPILHISSCLFRNKVLIDKKFDTKLTIGEDAKFITEVLKSKRAYGAISNSCLYYRKRSDGSSFINGQFKNNDFYDATVKRFLKYILNEWKDSKGKPARYVQNVVLYDLRWRLSQEKDYILNEKTKIKYKNLIYNLVSYIEDEVILSKRGMSVQQKRYLLDIKHNRDWYNQIELINSSYFFKSIKILNLTQSTIRLDFIQRQKSGLWLIEGYFEGGKLHPEDEIIIKVGVDKFIMKWTERRQLEKRFLGDIVDFGGAFKGFIKLNDIAKSSKRIISAYYKTFNNEEIKIPIQTNRFTGMSLLPLSYRCVDNFIFRKEHGNITVYLSNYWRLAWFETVFIGVISLNWRLHTLMERLIKLRRYNLRFLNFKRRFIEILKPFAFSIEAMAMIPRAILLRTAYHITRPFIRKPIWIISDRGLAAGDNGESLFRYIQNHNNLNARVYFAISKKSKDYNRLKKMGRVINQNSLYYKLIFLLSTKIISSHADTETTNPFIRQIDHYVDLFNFDFIFLQHGVIRHDLSNWLNKYEKNIKLFVTSAKKEYDSILHHSYYYEKEKIILTGLPRHDYLIDRPEGKLIIAPTYRKALSKMKTDSVGSRRYDPFFKNSEYFKFYNRLIHDKRIINVLDKYNMKGELYLHPVFASQVVDFKSNNRVQVMKFPYNYNNAFASGNLLITDYSSIVFDFVYLKKPVVYSQFDHDIFYEQQSYEKSDDFSDERDGFGEITYDYETLVNKTVQSIKRGCTMSIKYKKRVDDFFFKTDRKNTKRVFEAINKFSNNEASV